MPYVVNKGSHWQARWKLSNGRWKAETQKAWTKGAAKEYARRMEEDARRTPWATASPAELPYLFDYGLTVLMTRTVSPKTQKDQSAAWRNRVAPHFDGLKLNEVAPVDVRSMISALDGAGYAPSTVRDTYGLVAFVFTTAVSDGLVAASPCIRISLPRRRPEDEISPASPESVIAIARAIDPRYQALVQFLVATGARIGEALALKTEDVVQVPRPAVRIQRTLHDDGTFGPTKSRRSRTVTLPEWYVRILESQIAESHSEMVFPSPEGRPLPPRRFSGRYWRPAARRAGWEGVTPHQIRHLHVTQLLENHVPLTEVAARLGHSTPRVTAEVYAKWIQPDDSGAADATPDYSEIAKS